MFCYIFHPYKSCNVKTWLFQYSVLHSRNTIRTMERRWRGDRSVKGRLKSAIFIWKRLQIKLKKGIKLLNLRPSTHLLCSFASCLSTLVGTTIKSLAARLYSYSLMCYFMRSIFKREADVKGDYWALLYTGCPFKVRNGFVTSK